MITETPTATSTAATARAATSARKADRRDTPFWFSTRWFSRRPTMPRIRPNMPTAME